MQFSLHSPTQLSSGAGGRRTQLAQRSISSRRRCPPAGASNPGGDSGAPSSPGREPWDFGRFARTFTFFNPPPSFQKLLQTVLVDTPTKIIRGLQGVQQDVGLVSVPIPSSSSSSSSSPAQQAAALGADTIIDVDIDGIIMVAGATGGVGRRVVQRLLAAGKHVRALVRDLDKAKELLSSSPCAPGAKLELAGADLAQQQTLLPEYFRGVRALIICSAAKVQPKEGDTADRAKYMQGIKFYDPEIADASPEAVELRGVKHLLQLAAPHIGLDQGLTLLSGDGSGLQQWGPLDDVVMGGVSVSEIVRVPGQGEGEGEDAMVFRGNVSTNNSGGFASVRCRNFEPALDLGAYEGVELRLKGDGQRYKLILRTEPGWDSVTYCSSFDTQEGVWQTVRVPFTAFVPVFRAKTLKDGAAIDPSRMYSLQLMLSKFEYDGALNPSFRAGAFSLPLTRIAAYIAPRTCPRLVHLSSAGVTRPNRPGIDVSVEPPAVRMNQELGGLLTYKLGGEDAVRSAGLGWTVLRPCALTEEARGAPLELDQGDVIKGKVSREDVAELCCAVLGQPKALGCTFEIKSTVPFTQPWAPEAPCPKRDWAALLEAARLVPGVTGKTVDGRYTGREVEVQAAVAAQH